MNMDKQQKYEANDKMSDLICDNYSLLQVMCRFGIVLGFGDKTVKEVCEENEVDCHTFLAVINFMVEGFTRMEDDVESLSIPTLMKYLKSSHDYFLNFSLPAIHSKLEVALDPTDHVAALILNFFDQYQQEVKRHMLYEEKTVFKYVDSLLNGSPVRNYKITTYSKHHEQVEEKLTELKNIMIKYYPGKQNNNLMVTALFDIYLNEEWLDAHCKVEDYMFVPAIIRLERGLVSNEK